MEVNPHYTVAGNIPVLTIGTIVLFGTPVETGIKAMHGFRENLERFRRWASGHGTAVLFFALTFMQSAAIWLQRSFPTQDGPIQLYYADVLAGLLRGDRTYSAYFQMNNYSPVYCFFNYALVLLNQLFAPLTSERILVSLYVAAFSIGAWFLIRSIEPGNDWLPFFIMPFAFHAYLYLGIYNFTFGIATLLFAMGVWLRAAPAWTRKDWMLWLGMVLLICSVHPLTLAFLGLFVAGHTLAIFVTAVRAGGSIRAGWTQIASSVVAGAVPSLVLLAVVAYSASGTAGGASPAPVTAQAPLADRLRMLLQMVPLSPYFVPLYRFCLLLLVLLPMSLVAIRAARLTWTSGKRALQASFALGLTAVVGLGLFVFAPPWFLGVGFFADRMSVIFVVCGLAALAPLTLPKSLRHAAVATAVCVLPLMAAIRDRETAPIVRALAPIYEAKPAEGGFGAIVSGAETVDGLTFNPYYWAGAHYARQSQAILLNTPWIYGRLAIFTPRAAHPWDGASPDAMLRILTGPEAAAQRVAFVCGGKWDPGHREMASSESLAHGLGFVRVFESDIYYCDGKPAVTLRSMR
jgi:hypothetical protein